MSSLDQFHTWEKDAREFKGDRALFWEGKISDTAYKLINARAMELSSYVNLLDLVRMQYDTEIFSKIDGGRHEDI